MTNSQILALISTSFLLINVASAFPWDPLRSLHRRQATLNGKPLPSGFVKASDAINSPSQRVLSYANAGPARPVGQLPGPPPSSGGAGGQPATPGPDQGGAPTSPAPAAGTGGTTAAAAGGTTAAAPAGSSPPPESSAPPSSGDGGSGDGGDYGSGDGGDGGSGGGGSGGGDDYNPDQNSGDGGQPAPPPAEETTAAAPAEVTTIKEALKNALDTIKGKLTEGISGGS